MFGFLFDLDIYFIELFFRPLRNRTWHNKSISYKRTSRKHASTHKQSTQSRFLCVCVCCWFLLDSYQHFRSVVVAHDNRSTLKEKIDTSDLFQFFIYSNIRVSFHLEFFLFFLHRFVRSKILATIFNVGSRVILSLSEIIILMRRHFWDSKQHSKNIIHCLTKKNVRSSFAWSPSVSLLFMN